MITFLTEISFLDVVDVAGSISTAWRSLNMGKVLSHSNGIINIQSPTQGPPSVEQLGSSQPRSWCTNTHPAGMGWTKLLSRLLGQVLSQAGWQYWEQAAGRSADGHCSCRSSPAEKAAGTSIPLYQMWDSKKRKFYLNSIEFYHWSSQTCSCSQLAEWVLFEVGHGQVVSQRGLGDGKEDAGPLLLVCGGPGEGA